MSNLTISDIAIRHPCTVEQVEQLYLACGDLDRVDFFCRLMGRGFRFDAVLWLISYMSQNTTAEDVVTMVEGMSTRCGITANSMVRALREECIKTPVEAISKLQEWNEQMPDGESEDVPPIRVIRVTKET